MLQQSHRTLCHSSSPLCCQTIRHKTFSAMVVRYVTVKLCNQDELKKKKKKKTLTFSSCRMPGHLKDSPHKCNCFRHSSGVFIAHVLNVHSVCATLRLS